MRKNIVKYAICLAGSLGVAMSATAAPVPIEADTQIWVFQSEGSIVVSSSKENTAVESVFSSSMGSDIRARGSLATGQVGTYAATSDRFSSAQSIIGLYDTISFFGASTPTEVTYSFGLEGSLSRASTFSTAYVDGFVYIYDITGLSAWLESVPFVYDTSVTQPVPSAVLLSQSRVFKDLVPSWDVEEESLNVNEFLTGSFTAEVGRQYGVLISSNSYASGIGGLSDFYGTGTFSFQDLGGLTFSSGSGVFLSQQPVVGVPEPSTWLLLLTGLAALIHSVRVGARLKLPSGAH